MSISDQSSTTGQVTCSGSCSSRLALRGSLHCSIVCSRGAGALQLPDRGPVRHHGVARRQSRSKPHRRRAAARSGFLSRALSRQPQGRRRCAAIRQGAARRRTALPGGRGARTGHDRPSRQQDAACRLWAGAGRQRQFPAGVRRAQPRPQPRTIPIGGFSRRRAPCSINSAATTKRGSTTRAR